MKKITPEEARKKAFGPIDMLDLAAKLGANKQYVYNIKNGKKPVSWKQAIHIEEITTAMGHKVSRNVLRPDIFGA